MKKIAGIVALLVFMAGCGDPFRYLACPNQGTASRATQKAGPFTAVSEQDNSRLEAGVRYVPSFGLVVSLAVMLSDQAGEEAEISLARVTVLDDDGDELAPYAYQDWQKKKLRFISKGKPEAKRIAQSPLPAKKIRPGHDYSGKVYIPKHTTPDWLLLKVRFAGDEHLLIFRQESDKECLPEDLAWPLKNKLRRARAAAQGPAPQAPASSEEGSEPKQEDK